MKRNKREIKSNKGITLIALVVTIVILIILATISVNIIMQGGLIDRTSKGKELHELERERERLELIKADVASNLNHLGKVTVDTYVEELINQGIIIQEEVVDNGDGTKTVITDTGYSVTIEPNGRNDVKIIIEGKADGVIISASVSGNNGWFKQGETANISVTGIIKTYSGGTITNVSATKNEITIPEFSINSEGRYTISNIASDATIVIRAKDSNNKENEKTIPITIKIDNIAPILSDTKAIADSRLRIKISGKAIDNESGLKQINYTISPTTITPNSGTLTSGQEIELTATEEKEYTVTFIAEDNAGNTSTPSIVKVTSENSLSLEEAKKLINEETIQEFMGVKVRDFDREDPKGWRVFYYDKERLFWKKRRNFFDKFK